MRTLQLQFPDTALPTLETVLKESKEVRVFRRVAWRSSMKFKQGVLLRRALSQKGRDTVGFLTLGDLFSDNVCLSETQRGHYSGSYFATLMCMYYGGGAV